MSQEGLSVGDIVRFTDQGHSHKFDLPTRKRVGTITAVVDTDQPLMEHELKIRYETEKGSVGTQADYDDIIEIMERNNAEGEKTMLYRVETADDKFAGKDDNMRGAVSMAESYDESAPENAPHHVREVPKKDVGLHGDGTHRIVWPEDA